MSDGESIILNEGGILVSNARFVSGAHTFALAANSSVHGIEIAPSRWSPILLALFGVFLGTIALGTIGAPGTLWSGILILLLGIACIGTGVVTLMRQKPTFSIILTTAGGEVTAYSTKSRELAGRILDAMNHAIIARG